MNVENFARGFGAIGPLADGDRRAWGCFSGGRPALDEDRSGKLRHVWLQPERADLSLLNSGFAPLLMGHTQQLHAVVGVVEYAWAEEGALYASFRFGTTEQANEAWSQVANRVYRNLSVGTGLGGDASPSEDGPFIPEYWRPHEVSLVAVPADWCARIQPGPLPAYVTENRARNAADMASGTPASWKAFAEKAAPDIEAAARAGGPEAAGIAFRSAMGGELTQLAAAARARVLG